MRSVVTLPLFAAHLSGAQEIGTYPVTDSAHCRWGCIDIDLADDDARALELARDIQSAWRFFGVTAWVERSRSKGYHVWIFSPWMPAATMRHAGQYVARLIELDPKTEINPKNEAPWLVPNGLVNTVRTPYSGRARPSRMAMLDDDGRVIDLDDFVDCAMAKRARPQALQALAVDWRSLQRKEQAKQKAQSCGSDLEIGVSRNSRGRTQSVAAILDGTARAEVGERDNQFYAMARYLHGTGTPYELAMRIVEQRWQDVDPTDFPLAQALSKVERVYR